ncbi:hypothetical protein SeMB42_g02658 [Synchytrium endobioticum]|uniref:GRIP domain-containing protein n=1 Tax=Synchytrium endobioticum TaxID=286115 RepID=A0A507DCI9_9FUNG|nr:hypothetical protein SeMB42_g02658 [Synchytrium endobioticum]
MSGRHSTSSTPEPDAEPPPLPIPPSNQPYSAPSPLQPSPSQPTSNTLGGLFSLAKKGLTTSVTSLNGILPVSNTNSPVQQITPHIPSNAAPLITLATGSPPSSSLSQPDTSPSRYNERLAAKLSAARSKHGDSSTQSLQEFLWAAPAGPSVHLSADDDDHGRLGSVFESPPTIDSSNNISSVIPSFPSIASTDKSKLPSRQATLVNGTESDREEANNEDGLSETDSQRDTLLSPLPLQQSTPIAISSMTAAELQAKLDKLRKYESKFTDLAKAYKSLQGKLQAIEGVLASNTPVTTISSKEELRALESYLKDAKEKSEVPKEELSKLKRQLSEVKEVQQLESYAKNEMITTLQVELAAKNYEISKLKSLLESKTNESLRVSTTETPPESPTPSATPSLSGNDDKNADIAALKTKLKEMAVALRKVTDQRNKSTEERNKANETIGKLTAANDQLKSTASLTSNSPASNNSDSQDPSAGPSIQQLAQLQEQLIAQEELLRKSEERIKSCLDIIDELQLTNASLKNESKEFETRTINRLAELETKLHIAAEEAEITGSIKSDLARSRRQIKDLEAQITQLNSVAEEAKALAAEKTSEAEEAVSMRKAADQTLRALHADAQREASRASALQLELDNVRNKMQHLLDQALAARDDALTQVSEVSHGITGSKNEREAFEQEKRRFEERLAALVSELEASKRSAEVVSKQLEEIIATKNSTEKTLERKEAAYKQVVEELDLAKAQIQNDLNSHKRKMEKAENAYNEKVKMLQDTDTAVRQHVIELQNSEIKDLNGVVDSLNKEIHVLKTELAGNSASVNVLEQVQKQLDIVSTERAALIQQLESVKRGLESTKQELVTVNEDYQSLQKSHKHTGDQHKGQVTELETRIRDMTEALALAKQEIHNRDETLAEHAQSLRVMRQALAEEEEKKNKSIQLLRNSKQRIIKLETEAKERETELDTVKSNLNEIQSQREKETKEKETQMANLTRQVEDMSSRRRRDEESLREMDKKRREAIAETERLSTRVAELANVEAMLRREKEALADQLKVRNAEYESTLTLLEETSARLTLLETTAREIDDKSTIYEAELETSRRLFQTKSVECDAMRLKISELEAKIYDATQTAGRATDEVDSLRKELSNARKENIALGSQLKAFEEEISETRRIKASADRDVESFRNEVRLARGEIEGLRDRVKKLEGKEETWKNAVHVQEAKVTELLQSLADIEKKLQLTLAEREKIVEDSRMRESQLRNVNKALKEEVRKLSKQPASSGHSPPSSSRPSLTNLNDLQQRATSPASSAGPSSAMSITPMSSNTVVITTGHPANQEYLKNIILKFIEFKDKRSQLVQVLAMLLRFSPDELKRIHRTGI